MSLIDEINQILSRLDDAEPPSSVELHHEVRRLAKILKQTMENVESSLTHFDVQVEQITGRLRALESE